MFDVAVDLRRSSPTFGRSVGVVLSAAESAGCSGFRRDSRTASSCCPRRAEFLYKTTDYWYPEHERTLLWNDPALAIDWPLPGAPMLAAKDAAGGRSPTPTSTTERRCRAPPSSSPVRPGRSASSSRGCCRAHGEVHRARSRGARPRRRGCASSRRCADVRPQLIVNAGAYTAVDLAEKERDAAFAVNARAPGILAGGGEAAGALLIHYSTDYVFDGAAHDTLRRGRARPIRSTSTARASSKASARSRRPARTRSCCAPAGSTARAAGISC